MFSKIIISGKIEVVTGMHIGGSTQFSAIGAVDSPVIRDRYTNLPIIPGSSLKGKLRTLIAKAYSEKAMLGRHNSDPEVVLRLFGSSEKENIKSSRLIFSDMILSNSEELKEIGIHSATEIKFENTIDRPTALANPRQIERTIRGSQFDLELIYNVEEKADINEDFQAIADGLKLLHYDYLGGHGSRGYGKVRIKDIYAEVVVVDIDAGIMESCNKILGEV